MTGWKLRCIECGRTWVLRVSFYIEDMPRLYHYCPHCRRNTFHVIEGRVEGEGEGAGGKGRT
ncbi:MAG: hypothetical protein F7B17_09490 [Desulfurococcales archaeon]|nr:hypothetical protein [Desulfurococcales archaeon]